MHGVARNVVQPLNKYVPTKFGVAFDYNRVHFSMLDNCLVTVKESPEGEFQKYVNNIDEPIVPSKDEQSTLVHCMKKRKPSFTTAILCQPENSCFFI